MTIEDNNLDEEGLPERPKVLDNIKTIVQTQCGNMGVTVTHLPDGTPYEVFIELGKGGNCTRCLTESVGRMISTALRFGVPITSIIKQMKGIHCQQVSYEPPFLYYSCIDAVAYVLSEMYEEDTNEFRTANRSRPTAQ